MSPANSIKELSLAELEQVLSVEPESVLNNLWPDRVPLFRHTNLVVDTKVASGGRRILCRDFGMEDMLGSAAIRLRDDIAESRPKFLSIIYLLVSDDPDPCFYVGICQRWGRVHSISANIADIYPRWVGLSRFARWGDGEAWHIGQLSDALFTAGSQHNNWADSLFVARGTPTLKREVCFSCLLVKNENEMAKDSMPDGTLKKRVRHAERLLIQHLQKSGLTALNVHGAKKRG